MKTMAQLHWVEFFLCAFAGLIALLTRPWEVIFAFQVFSVFLFVGYLITSVLYFWGLVFKYTSPTVQEIAPGTTSMIVSKLTLTVGALVLFLSSIKIWPDQIVTGLVIILFGFAFGEVAKDESLKR